MLDESDIDAITKHLGAKVQFYDARGVADNGRARNEIRTALESFVGTSTPKSAERFRLVEIALEKTMDVQIQFADPDEMGAGVVKLADAVLAAMDKADEAKQAEDAKRHFAMQDVVAGKTPDTGPSAEEVEEEIIEIDEDGVVHAVGEKPNLAIVLAIRAQIQAQLDADLKADAKNLTTNVRLSGFLEGESHARKHILEMIDAAMEKSDAAAPAKTIWPTRTEDGDLLV